MTIVTNEVILIRQCSNTLHSREYRRIIGFGFHVHDKLGVSSFFLLVETKMTRIFKLSGPIFQLPFY